MGVINNLILIRKIVGHNWNGTSISDILDYRPIPKFTTQPSDTSGTAVLIGMNIAGYFAKIQRLDGETWRTAYTSSVFFNDIQLPLSAITTTSKCRVVVMFGGVEVISDEFTVTRTAAQLASAKTNSLNESETLELTDETPVVEKTTTTKKGN